MFHKQEPIRVDEAPTMGIPWIGITHRRTGAAPPAAVPPESPATMREILEILDLLNQLRLRIEEHASSHDKSIGLLAQAILTDYEKQERLMRQIALDQVDLDKKIQKQDEAITSLTQNIETLRGTVADLARAVADSVQETRAALERQEQYLAKPWWKKLFNI